MPGIFLFVFGIVVLVPLSASAERRYSDNGWDTYAKPGNQAVELRSVTTAGASRRVTAGGGLHEAKCRLTVQSIEPGGSVGSTAESGKTPNRL